MQRKHPGITEYLFAIEAGEKRHPATSAKLKKIGLKGGMYDYFLMIPRAEYHGLFVEFKYGKNNLSPSQKTFRCLAQGVNYKCVTVWTVDDGEKEVLGYLGKKQR